MRSVAWVSTKPSMFTMTGSDSSSARRKAWMCRSVASWLDSAKSITHPASRTAMASLWSFQMLIGAPIALLARVITTGQAKSGGVVDRLDHEQEALAGSRRVGPRSGRRGADRHRHRRELRLDVDELASGELAGLGQLPDAFDDVSLRA